MNRRINDVLAVITKKLENEDIQYVIVGSTSLALQGLPLEPRDIDIATTKNSLVLIQNKLEEYIKVKMERRLSKINLRLGFKKYAYFLTLEINGIKVDAMSNFKIKNTPLKYKKEDIVFIDLKGLKVPCLSIKKTYSAYVLAENKEKVELIKPYL